ncbi:MAG: DUF1015 domain-containing protein [Planctomycetota bacterium]
MPTIHPFQAIQFSRGQGDVSASVAPPYDVLDAKSKAALLHRHPRNVVGIDLPHVPAKELGPSETYAKAGDTFRQWLAEAWLTRRDKPAIFAYRQTFQYRGRTHLRSGMACTLEAVPFGPRAGGGILPHEETFSGPKEDRMALMKATAAQLSPIFGLHQDDKGVAASFIRNITGLRQPDMTARMDFDNVLHEVWTVDDPEKIAAYAAALAGEDVFIADGHHRYNTALNYLSALEAQHKLPPNHPARRCMFVLVSMSDPGLVIGPTHRVLGGMKDYTIDAFLLASRGLLRTVPGPANVRDIEQAMAADAPTAMDGNSGNVFGVIDFKSGKSFVATLTRPDPLAPFFPGKPKAWRELDVAIIQHAIVERVCQPVLNAGQPVKWAFPHSVDEVLEIGKGLETGAGGGSGFAQLAIIVRPTPLASVRSVSRANELMPQKSTFFYPKLATGLFLNGLE